MQKEKEMPMKNKGRKTYRSMQGKVVDLDLLIKRNELTPAVGNAKVNARGDELGPGGKIVRKREEVMKEYYKTAPVVHQSKKKELSEAEAAELEEFDAEPVPPKPATKVEAKKPAPKKAEPAKIVEVEEDDWVEDEDGNFVKKGD